MPFVKKLLKSAESKRIKEKCQLLKERDKQDERIRNIVSGLDYFIIQKAIKKNEEKSIQKTIESHENKLYKLTQYASLPFSTAEVIKNRLRVIAGGRGFVEKWFGLFSGALRQSEPFFKQYQ